jgi:hypothetical protein
MPVPSPGIPTRGLQSGLQFTTVRRRLEWTDHARWSRLNRSGLSRPELLMRLGEALVHVQGEFQRGECTGGFDEVAGVAGQAGQHVADHRRVG